METGNFKLHWATVRVPDLQSLTEVLGEVFEQPKITLFVDDYEIHRIGNDVCNELAIVHRNPNPNYFVNIPGALFDRGIGFKILTRLILAYDRRQPSVAALSRIDPKLDRIGELVTDVWPVEYMSNKFLSHPKSWEPQRFGDPPNSFRLVHKEAKMRVYDKIRQIQDLIADKKATALHHDFLREHRGNDVARVEFEIRGRFCEEYADPLIRTPNIDEITFANNVASYFIRNNPFKEEATGSNGQVLKKKRICSFWSALDPLENGYMKVEKVRRTATRDKAFDDLGRTASFIRNKFKKWGYSKKEAIGYLLNIFDLNNNEWLWNSELPTYEELLERYIKEHESAAERAEGQSDGRRGTQ